MAIVEGRTLPQAKPSIKNKVCAFWQQNRCLKGSSCDFIHAKNRLQPSETPEEAEKRAIPGRRVLSLKRASQPEGHQPQDLQQEKKPRPGIQPQPQRICKFWQDGRCKLGESCLYLHPKEIEPQRVPVPVPVPASRVLQKAEPETIAAPSSTKRTWQAEVKRKQPPAQVSSPVKKRSQVQAPAARSNSTTPIQVKEKKPEQRTEEQGGVRGLELVTTLKAHEQSITGIALVVDSALLFTGSSDQTVRAWNCESGQCLDTIRVQGGVSSIVSASGWVFVAVGKEVLAWNPKLSTKVALVGAGSEITVLATGEGCLIAGTTDGAIYGWNFVNNAQEFSAPSSFVASSAGVSALRVVAGRIYSGFSDGSIRLWDLTQLSCLNTVSHSSASPVTGLALCSGASLFSSSGDGVVRSWSGESLSSLGDDKLAGGGGVFESCDAGGKPVLGLFRDSRIKVVELPGLEKMGELMFDSKVTKVVSSPETNLVFVGDNEGAVKVWRWILN